MKLVISESQFKRLVSEQVIGSYTPDNGTIHDKGPAVVQGVKNYVKNLTPHDVMTMTALAAGILIPFPGGLAVASLIGALDAYQYKLEKNNRMAGLTLMMAALPGVISVANRIPGVKQLGTKGMVLLADKLEKGIVALAPEESIVAAAIRDNLPFVEREYQAWVKKTADTLAKKGVGKVQSNVAKTAYNALTYDPVTVVKQSIGDKQRLVYGLWLNAGGSPADFNRMVNLAKAGKQKEATAIANAFVATLQSQKTQLKDKNPRNIGGTQI